jgi:AcrR family transcriptional regulator
MIEEAAAELFLEHGYGGTRVEEIARVAGISRASFFNYFDAKSDVLWVGADDALERLERALDDGATLREALIAVAASVDDTGEFPLALSQAETMEAREDLLSSGAARLARLHGIVRRAVPGDIDAAVVTAAVAAGWSGWARGRAGRQPLREQLRAALDRVATGVPVA